MGLAVTVGAAGVVGVGAGVVVQAAMAMAIADGMMIRSKARDMELSSGYADRAGPGRDSIPWKRLGKPSPKLNREPYELSVIYAAAAKHSPGKCKMAGGIPAIPPFRSHA